MYVCMCGRDVRLGLKKFETEARLTDVQISAEVLGPGGGWVTDLLGSPKSQPWASEYKNKNRL